MYKDQLKSVVIHFDENHSLYMSTRLTYIFGSILTMFRNLTSLNFRQSLVHWQYMSLNISPKQHIESSSLIKLNINLKKFNDCLYLLDGRFNELNTLSVNILEIDSSATIDRTVNKSLINNILNKFCFSRIQ